MPNDQQDLLRRKLSEAAKHGRGQAAEQMEALAAQFPFLGSAATGQVPTVLLFRSIRYAHAKVGPDDDVQLWIPEGHFSTKFFLESFPGRQVIANVFGANLPAGASAKPADVAINTISCPDLHKADLTALSAYLAEHPDMPVINHPDLIQRTARVDICDVLAGIPGLFVPRTKRILLEGDDLEATLSRELAEFDSPVILREAGAHTGRTVFLLRNQNQLSAVLDKFGPGTSIYATQFVDSRGDARGDSREDARLFTKFRAFFIDGAIYPVARLVSNAWSIRSGDRYRVMFAMPDAQRHERAYLSDPESALGPAGIRALEEVQRRLELDFCGIDFTRLPNGDLLLFEANPVMRHNYDHAKTFAYTKPNLDRISRAFADMVQARIALAVS
ncbi:MAG: hypothetical protein AAGK00_11710 [Pseudomonadota bacterium]